AVLPEAVLRLRRPWDEAAWPLSNRGYSRLRSAIPRLTAA
ncbi:deoxyribodipyrimidine photolyase, partial [Methylobacterium sp. WL122]